MKFNLKYQSLLLIFLIFGNSLISQSNNNDKIPSEEITREESKIKSKPVFDENRISTSKENSSSPSEYEDSLQVDKAKPIKEKSVLAKEPDRPNNNPPGTRYGILNSRKVGGAEYFAIYPSITMQISTMDIKSPIGSALMVPENSLPVFVSLEAKSTSYHFGQYWGLVFHARTYEFDYNRQNVKTESYFNGDSSSGGSGSGYSTKDLGSRIRGRYSHAFPAIYFGAKGEDRAKLGVGVGPSQATISGNANFYSSVNPVLFRAQGLDRAGFLDEVARSQLFLGADPSLDPLRTYFLANLNQGNNLELLGVYLAGKGDVSVPNFNLTTILQLQYLNNTGNFTPLEIFTLYSLNNGAYSNRLKSNATWTVFYEYPAEAFTFQIQVTSPLYYSGINRFRFSFIDVSIQVPIEF